MIGRHERDVKRIGLADRKEVKTIVKAKNVRGRDKADRVKEDKSRKEARKKARSMISVNENLSP